MGRIRHGIPAQPKRIPLRLRDKKYVLNVWKEPTDAGDWVMLNGPDGQQIYIGAPDSEVGPKGKDIEVSVKDPSDKIAVKDEG